MRVMRKGEDGKWKKEAPDDILRWMWKCDGEDAVVVDDERKEYFCGNEATRMGYELSGKTALTFHDLGWRLFHEQGGSCGGSAMEG